MERPDWNFGNGHLTIADYCKTVNVDDYFKWCFVRNPWDRIVSAYEGCVDVNEHISFEKFINTIYKNKIYFKLKHIFYYNLPDLGLPVTRIHFYPMIKMISVVDKVKIDFIGKFENLENDWKKVLDICKIPYEPLVHMNARQTRRLKNSRYKYTPYKEYYTQELIDKVAELYAEDIKYFNYDYV